MAKVVGKSVGQIEITKGDRLRSFAATLRDAETKAAINLTGDSVTFRMVELSDYSVVVINNVAATLDVAASGQVSYPPAANDVDAAGTFAAWWIRTSGGKTEHFPSGGDYITVVIADSY